MKDTRPLADKKYQQKLVRSILDFLRANHYPNDALTSRHFPLSSKEFFNIFNFLFSFTNPGYMGGQDHVRNEDRVIRLLKDTLKYPGQLSRSDLITMNSLHSWPRVLGALSFLCDTVKIGEKTKENILQIAFPSKDKDGFPTGRDSNKKLKTIYKIGCYQHFMAGYEEFGDELENYKRALLDNNEVNIEKLQSLEEESKKLQHELESKSKEPDRLKDAQTRFLKREGDMQKMRKYLTELKKKRSEFAGKHNALEAQIQAVDEEVEKKEEELKTHKKDKGVPSQVNVQLEEDKRRRVQAIDQELEAGQSEIWKLQVEHYRKVGILEKICREFNSMCIDLQQFDGEDFLSLPMPTLAEGTVTPNPAVDQLHEQLEEQVRERKVMNAANSDKLVQMDRTIETMQDDIEKQTKRLEEMQKELTAQETQLQELKQRIDEEERQLDKNINDLKNDLQQLRIGSQNEREDLKKEIESKKEELKKLKEYHVDRIKKGDQFLEQVTKKVKDYVLDLHNKKERKLESLNQQRRARAAAVSKALEEVEAMESEIQQMVTELEKEDK